MLNDGFARNALAPFVLRIALAVIFIYHGLGKVVGEGKQWGAEWAVKAWRERAKPPRDASDHLARRAAEADEQLKAAEKEAEAAGEDKKADAEKKVQAAKERLDKALSAKAELESSYVPQRPSEELPPEAIGYHWAQLAVAWGELLGGFALLFGLLTRVAAVGLLVIQVGAILTVTAARGFSFVAGGGYEYNVALIAMCLALVFAGGGPLAVDNVIFTRGRDAQQASALGQPAGAPVR